MDQRHFDNGSVVEAAIERRVAAEQTPLLAALEALVTDDPSLRFSFDAESGQIIIGGQSEQHLESAVHQVMRIHGVALTIGAPQVSYRERITRAVDIDHTYSKIIGARGEFARVRILFEPTGPNSGFTFENGVSSDTLLETHIAGVCQGLQAARLRGVLAGFPIIDFKATLTGGAYHEVDSNGRTFEIAAMQTVRMLGENRAVELVEPIFAAELATPDEFLGGVIGDLNERRGQVLTLEKQGEASLIKALVPVSTMIGYLDSLRELTRGKGTASLRLDHYEAVPRGTNDDDPRFPPPAAMRMRA